MLSEISGALDTNRYLRNVVRLRKQNKNDLRPQPSASSILVEASPVQNNFHKGHKKREGLRSLKDARPQI